MSYYGNETPATDEAADDQTTDALEQAEASESELGDALKRCIQ
jgi:hypothetical protein